MVLSPLREEASKIRELILNGEAVKAERLLPGLYEKYAGIDESAYLDFVKSILEVAKSNEKDWSTETNEYLKKQALKEAVEEHLKRLHALYLPGIDQVRLPHGGHIALIDFENDISRLKRRNVFS